MKHSFFILSTFVVLLLAGISFAFQKHNKEQAICVSAKEMDLYNAINQYRKENGLQEINLSTSLCKVAQTHAYDLTFHRPFTSKCNMHSWSDKGKWTPCCYTEDHKQAACMWDKPRELTKYKGNGFEICHGYAQFEKFSGDTVSVAGALAGWKSSKGHNNVILNKETWAQMKWNAIGIGINRDFVCVLFGVETDSELTPIVCK
jgi:cbb3-type cytochrome oxidase subunit 3